jgi:hypothetical protein
VIIARSDTGSAKEAQMKMKLSVIAVVLLMAAMVFAQDAAKKPQEKPAAAPASPPTVSQVLDRQLSSLERQLVPLVEAMPEDKFNFAPSGEGFAGVRTFAQQAGHIAANNFFFANALTGEAPTRVKADDRLNGPALKTKAEMVQYLKDSFAEAHRAVSQVNDKNLLEMVTFPFGDAKASRLYVANVFTWHGFDHYGQMVEYLRMNNIIPPASRTNN